jgi:fructoselysine 6-kinase
LSTAPPLVCGIGDNVVDRYPDLEREFPGGNACNVAVYARRSGARAAYIGVVGSDASGDHVLATLEAEGVDTSGVRAGGGANSHATVRIDASGNREFVEWVPVDQQFDLSADDRALLRTADVAHTGHASFTELLVPDLATLTRISFDFSYKDLDYAEPLLPHLWAATFSGAGLSAGAARDLATSVGSAGPEVVVVTRGAAGATVAVGGDVVEQAAVPTRVVDTLGAGDAFVARLLTGLLRGETPDRAAAASAVLAGHVCESFGAIGHARPLLDNRKVT